MQLTVNYHCKKVRIGHAMGRMHIAYLCLFMFIYVYLRFFIFFQSRRVKCLVM